MDDQDFSLSELQLALMRVLWARGEAGNAEVAEALRLQQRPLAHTTVATLLTRLEKRGLLEARRDGRALLYRPLVSEAQVQRSMVSGLLGNLFAGQASALLSHLVDEKHVGADELAQMKTLLAKKRGSHA
ncbi:MAG TPA: BlaI/MecI/CopY family transcriptional regulator [Burkholderiaceae bacterium]